MPHVGDVVMPIYEYECLTCGATFEKRQSFSDAPAAECPKGHSETRRLLSAPAIVFKGSGFGHPGEFPQNAVVEYSCQRIDSEY